MRCFMVFMSVLLLVFVRSVSAQDDLEDIGPDGTQVTSRVIAGVTVTISPQAGLPLTARTYNVDTLIAFNGGGNQPNTPLNPGDVSGTRFISNVGDTINFANAEPITFEFDLPIGSFGLTTLDLLEDGEVGAEIRLQAYDAVDSLIDEQVRSGPQGASGLDLDWFVSGNGIVKVLLSGSLAGGFSGYGIDDLLLTIENPGNRPPKAVDDVYLYLEFFRNAQARIPVVENDSDPDGDSIRVVFVTDPGEGATIVSFNNNSVTYAVTEWELVSQGFLDSFFYIITDGQAESDPGVVDVYFCVCPVQCLLSLVIPPTVRPTSSRPNISTKTYSADSLDVELFRGFRDEALLPTQTGADFVDLYYQGASEVMPLLIFERPDLGTRAYRALQLMQDPIRDLVEGDGSMLITQQLIDTVSGFIDSLLASVSDSLQASLNFELTRLGPLQDLVGLPVAEAVDIAIGDSSATSVQDDWQLVPGNFILEQNFPNPFNPSTQIRYQVPNDAEIILAIYNIRGQEVMTLVNEVQTAGDKSVTWNGRDNKGRNVPSGIYFYRLSAGTVQHTKKMLFMK